MDAATLNVGLNIAMEWGEDWLQPIQERLRARFPKLDVAAFDECNEICQAAMRTGYELASECMIGIGLSDNLSEEKNREIKNQFTDDIRARFAWIDDDNAGRLYSQGCYYAMK